MCCNNFKIINLVRKKTMVQNTIRLTMAQALVKYLCNQYILINDKKEQLYAGVFGIFGHGNVTCLAEAFTDS